MDREDAEDEAGAPAPPPPGPRPRRPPRGSRPRILVVLLLSLLVVVMSVLAWQLTSRQLARARSATAASPSNAGGNEHPATSSASSTPTSARPRRRTTGSSGSTVTSTVSSTVAPSTTTTATTAAGPLRVLEIGDSLGVDLGIAMENLYPSSRVALTVAARSDTGLSNSGFYDWPQELLGLLSSVRPQVVIVLLGANDLQSIVTGATILSDGTPAWSAAYAARVTSIISESVRAGARVLWVGEPAMQDAFLNAGMTRIDGIAQRVVAHYPGDAAYLASSATLAPTGSFAEEITKPTGAQVQVRTPDGVHLTATGADMLADAVGEALANAWGMQVLDP